MHMHNTRDLSRTRPIAAASCTSGRDLSITLRGESALCAGADVVVVVVVVVDDDVAVVVVAVDVLVVADVVRAVALCVVAGAAVVVGSTPAIDTTGMSSRS
jgi:hypothetical protein